MVWIKASLEQWWGQLENSLDCSGEESWKTVWIAPVRKAGKQSGLLRWKTVWIAPVRTESVRRRLVRREKIDLLVFFAGLCLATVCCKRLTEFLTPSCVVYFTQSRRG